MTRPSKADFELSARKRALLEAMLEAEGLDASEPEKITRQRQGDFAPMSFAQERMWFLDKLMPGNPAYNVATAVRLRGQLKVSAFEKSISEILRRHESLRTSFGIMDGQPAQIIHPAQSFNLPLVDLAELPDQEKEFLAKQIVLEAAMRPFNLTTDTLLRISLLRLSETDHVASLAMHHIVSDGWSMGILMSELEALYRAYSMGLASPLAEMSIQYADFAQWQRQWLEGEVMEKQMAYWRQQLEGAVTVIDLPTDRPRPPVQSHRGSAQAFEFSEELMGAIRNLAQQEGATLFMVMLAAFKSLLYRYTGQEDIVVGTPIAGRNQADIEGLIGFFVNMLVLRTDLSGNPTFRQLLARVKEIALEAYAHQDLPFEKLVDELQLERDLSRAPLVQVSISLQNLPGRMLALGDVKLTSFELESHTAKFDLDLSMSEDEQRLALRLEYSTDLFDDETITRMFSHLKALLKAVLANPDAGISDLSIMTAEERREILGDWNDTKTDYPNRACIHELFERQVELSPEVVAVIYRNRHLSYRELNARANQLAGRLRSMGVGPETRVAVCVNRSPEMIVALLAVLKSGGAYVPLDLNYPKERLSFMLENSRSPVLLTEHKLLKILPRNSALALCLDSDWPEIAKERDGNINSAAVAENLAYVIYTSGSTGAPKGVAIQHRSAVAMLSWAASVFTSEEMAGVLAATSICFDLSVFELFAPLSRGGKVILAENALSLPELESAELVRLINTVPSAMTELVQAGAIPASVKAVNLAGEALSRKLVERIYMQENIKRVFNLYGPTEDTTYSTFALINGRAGEGVTIGRPVSNSRVYLLDVQMQPVPVGVYGEIYIAGDGLARGYLNETAMTAEKFVPDPFSEQEGERLYRTGDIGRYLADGRIEFKGRSDHQIKVRGFRVEPAEIEAALASYPQIKEAVVIAREDAPGDKRLVAYFIAEQGDTPSVDEIRSHLRSRLPEYLLPARFVMLGEFPLTANGKLDRRALPAPNQGRPDLTQAYVAPRTTLEKIVAEIWEDVLGIDRAGIHDNFFSLGGHSIRAVVLIHKLQERLSENIHAVAIFNAPTIAELAEYLEHHHTDAVSRACGDISFYQAAETRLPHNDADNSTRCDFNLSAKRLALLDMLLVQEGGDPTQVERIPRREKESLIPLSFAQERLWFLNQLMPDNPFYNMPAAIRLDGGLNTVALEKSLNEIVRRHESLRTTFAIVEGGPVQVIAPELNLVVPVIDLCELEADAREEETRRFAAEDAEAPFDLQNGPMLRSSIVRLSDTDHVLLLAMHHIVSDAWSVQVLVSEVTRIYDAFSRGEQSPLKELPIQYADYAVWERRYLTGETLEKHLRYWRKQLSAIETLELPLDRPRPAIQSYRGASCSSLLTDDLSAALKRISQLQSATIFMTMLAAFKALLYRYSGQDHIVVGTPIAGRGRAELEGLIGFFVNTLVMRTDLAGEPSFAELMRRVREVALGAYTHQDVPFEKLVDELQPERSLSHSPLFQVVFNFLNVPTDEAGPSGLAMDSVAVDPGTARFDLTLRVIEAGGDYLLSLVYNTDLLHESTAERMLAHYIALLKAGVTNPDCRISALPILSKAERDQLLALSNNDKRDFAAATCLHNLFEARAEKAPDSVAVVFEQERLTYGELNRRANQLAHYLQTLGVGPEVKVGICVERSSEMILAVLGILKSGGAYVPLDPAYPKERLAFMVEDAQMPVVLTEQGLVERLPLGAARLVSLDQQWHVIARESMQNPTSGATVGNLAYVIYTSGSTGKPKGVLITHYNVVRLFEATRQWFHFDESDVWTLFHSYAFDFSVWELWGALLHGGRLIVVPYFASRSPESFYDTLGSERVTVLNQTPSAFRQLIAAHESAAVKKELALRAVIFGGEALELESLKPWLDLSGDRRPRLVNMYGITETTVHVTYRPITGNDLGGKRASPIGAPIPDVQVYVLDRDMQMVPAGVAGEIYVGGAGVARGYLNRADLTAERFVPNPFGSEPGARLYRAGDRARYLSDGDMEYLGRIDHQVKIRGFRIELGEIESALGAYPLTRECAVIAREDTPGDRRLVAYVVLKQDSALMVEELRNYLKEKLPDYMLPAAFVILEQLPLTINGKLDRRALPSPGEERLDFEQGFVPPRTALEDLLAELWRGALGIKRIGVHDNFFDLGGDSIRAAIFINKLQEKLGEVVHVVVIFNAPTVARLAEYLNENYASAVARICEDSIVTSYRPMQIGSSAIAQIREMIKPLPPRRQAETRSKNPQAIFVLSPPRSGSTLFRVMLAGHPLLFAPPELELLSFNTLEERRAAFTGADSFWLEGTIRAIIKIKNCDAAQAKAIMKDFEERKLTAQQFYRQMQEWIGERRLVDKTPSYALDIEVLKRAEQDFEDPLYIHLSRHPFAMIRSFEEARLDQVFFRRSHSFTRRELAALIWIISNQNILEHLKDVPPHRHHRVRFEELVSQPEAVLKAVCKFLGLELHMDMLQPYKDKQRRMTDGIYAESRMLGDVKFHNYSEIDSNVGSRWKDFSTDDDLGEEAWRIAEALGYEKGQKRSSAARVRRDSPAHIQRIQRGADQEAPLSFAGQRPSFLEQLQPGGSKRPFFCVHPAGGNVFCYADLAQHLGQSQPFYAFRAPGINRGEAICTGIDQMAYLYIKAMRATQIEGPYLLGGWSFGGLVAFEMACQLQAAGEQVPLLVLIDSRIPKRYPDPTWDDGSDSLQLMMSFGQNLGLQLEHIDNISPEYFSRLDMDEQFTYVLEQARLAKILPAYTDVSHVRRLFEVFKANVSAAASYSPEIKTDRIVLFKASERGEQALNDPTMGWDGLAACNIEVHEIPGNHFSMIREPNVQVLAERLKSCIDDAPLQMKST